MHATFTTLLDGLWLIRIMNGQTVLYEMTAKTWEIAQDKAIKAIGG